MKKLLTLISSIFMINLVSAYYGSYRSFSLSDFLDSIDAATLVLVMLFILFFAILNYILARVFKDNKATAGVVAFCVSVLATYGINRFWDVEDLFYMIGFSDTTLFVILPILILVAIIFLVWKFGIAKTLLFIAVSSIGVSFTNLVYVKMIPIIMGIVFLVIGLWLLAKEQKEPNLRLAYAR